MYAIYNLNILYQNLKKYSDFDIDDNSENFLATVNEILSYKDPASITVLLDYLDDDSDYGWINLIIQNNIFYLFENGGVAYFMKKLGRFYSVSPNWCVDTVSIIFNDQKCFYLFKSNMYLASREALLKLFDVMEHESPHHKELIAELRKELGAF